MKNDGFESASLTPDTFSERGEMPTLMGLKGNLFLADRGYYYADFILELNKAGGYYVLRAKGLKRVLIHSALRQDGQQLINI